MTQDDFWQSLISQPSDARIHYLYSDVYWEIAPHQRVLESMADRLSMPDKKRPYCMLITSESGMGKTTVAEEFQRRHPESRERGSGQLIQPVLYYETPYLTNPVDFMTGLLEKTGCVVPDHSLPILKRFYKARLTETHIGIFIVDELQRIQALKDQDALQILEILKATSQDTKRPVICMSTSAVLSLFYSDNQIKSRFKHLEIEPWQLDDHFGCFVQAVLDNMPLRDGYDRAIHTDRQHLSALHQKCEGNTGLLIQTIQQTAAHLIASGQETLTPDDFL